jgi:hypothetical protein
MSGRRRDPRQAGLEQALRKALRLAVEAVDPGADGLDKIRAKIAARHVPAGAAGGSPRWRFLTPAGRRLRYAFGAVAERFRPEPGRAGWIGWLRPAAAVTTGAFVMAAAGWAVAALPRALGPASVERTYHPTPHHRHAPTVTYPGGTYGTGPGQSPSPAASCVSPTGSVSASPSVSPTVSPSTSPSGSASPSDSQTSSPTVTQSAIAAPQPASSVLLPALAPPSPAPSGQTSPAPAPSPSGSATASPGPSASASPPASPSPCGVPASSAAP